MAKDNTQDFLQAYKSLEQTTQSILNLTVRDYEDQDQENGKKLQICRLIRNYASHQTDLESFLPIPTETINFIRTTEKKIIASKGEAKDYLKKITPVKASDGKINGFKRLCNICTKYSIKEAPVIDEKGFMIGLITINHLVQYTAGKDSGDDLVACLGLTKNYVTVAPKCAMATVSNLLNGNDLIVITADGTKNGKYIGIITKADCSWLNM